MARTRATRPAKPRERRPTLRDAAIALALAATFAGAHWAWLAEGESETLAAKVAFVALILTLGAVGSAYAVSDRLLRGTLVGIPLLSLLPVGGFLALTRAWELGPTVPALAVAAWAVANSARR